MDSGFSGSLQMYFNNKEIQAKHNIYQSIPKLLSSKQKLVNAQHSINQNLINLPTVTFQINSKETKMPEVKPQPISPSLSPIERKDIKMGKNYYWCACGMSKKQVRI